jgi:hypothetical protein
MRFRKTFACASLAIGLTSYAQAQLPGVNPAAGGLVPGGTAPPAPLPTGIAPYPAMPGEPTIWSRLGVSQAQREYRHRQMCRTSGGQLIGKLVNPLSILSGGLISPFCPTTPSLAELQDPGAVGAAAKVKQDRAAAEDRMKAVKYLGSVDCHYWPEAEEALVAALRGDRNECVRYEAAVTLGSGCCCTPKVIAALSHSVSCSDKDGFPTEKSPRVRSAAAHALEHCLQGTCCAPELPTLDLNPIVPNDKKDDKKDDKKLSKLGDPNYFKEYYALVAQAPRNQVYNMGRKALEIGSQIGYTVTNEINATDFNAAGMSSDGQAQPNNLWDMFNKRGTTPSIANPVPAPAYVQVQSVETRPLQLPERRQTVVNPITSEPRMNQLNQQNQLNQISQPQSVNVNSSNQRSFLNDGTQGASPFPVVATPQRAPVAVPAPTPLPVSVSAPIPVPAPMPAPVSTTPAPLPVQSAPTPVFAPVPVPVSTAPVSAPSPKPIAQPAPAPVVNTPKVLPESTTRPVVKPAPVATTPRIPEPEPVDLTKTTIPQNAVKAQPTVKPAPVVATPKLPDPEPVDLTKQFTAPQASVIQQKPVFNKTSGTAIPIPEPVNFNSAYISPEAPATPIANKKPIATSQAASPQLVAPVKVPVQPVPTIQKDNVVMPIFKSQTGLPPEPSPLSETYESNRR